MSLLEIIDFLGNHPNKMKDFMRKVDDIFSTFMTETIEKHCTEIDIWFEKYRQGKCSVEDFADKFIELSKK